MGLPVQNCAGWGSVARSISCWPAISRRCVFARRRLMSIVYDGIGGTPVDAGTLAGNRRRRCHRRAALNRHVNFLGTRVVHAGRVRNLLVTPTSTSSPLAFPMHDAAGGRRPVASLLLSLLPLLRRRPACVLAVALAAEATLAHKEDLAALATHQLQQDRLLVAALVALSVSHARIANVREVDDHAEAWQNQQHEPAASAADSRARVVRPGLSLLTHVRRAELAEQGITREFLAWDRRAPRFACVSTTTTKVTRIHAAGDTQANAGIPMLAITWWRGSPFFQSLSSSRGSRNAFSESHGRETSV